MSTEKSITDKTVPDLKNAAKFEFITGPREGATVPVDRQSFFIGRSKNNNLILTDRTVSRKHAVLNFLDGQFILSDLDSFWGVHVNGERIKEMPIRTGDIIKFGHVKVRFVSGEAPALSGHKRPRNLRLLWPILAALAAVVVLVIYLAGGGKKNVGNETPREIEYNYQQGIRAYNVDKNIDSARAYWERVIELDPQKKTPQSRKAMILLKNLTGDAGGQERPVDQ